jgi:hypothetical protein
MEDWPNFAEEKTAAIFLSLQVFSKLATNWHYSGFYEPRIIWKTDEASDSS